MILNLSSEICCSSGRLDCLKDIKVYQMGLLNYPDSLSISEVSGNADEKRVAIIPIVVALAELQRKVADEIYLTATTTMASKATTALQLDESVALWKAGLPSFLNFSSTSLQEPEWASKQKLVLHLRKYFITV